MEFLYALSGFLFVLLAFYVILYIFNALGLYTMAQREGISYAWIAWIPLVQNFLIGDLINNKLWGFGYTNWILVIVPIVTSVLSQFSSMSWVSGVISLAFYNYTIFAYYKLFKIYKPESTVLYTVLGIIFPFLFGIWTFIIRNNPREEVVD